MAFRRSTGLRNKLLGIDVNLVTNSTFDTDTSGWSANNSTLASVAGGVSGNRAEITNSTTANGQMYQVVNVKVGRTYNLKTSLLAGTAGIKVMVGTPTNLTKYYDSSVVTDTAVWQDIDVTFEVDESQLQITFQVDSTTLGNIGYVDNCYLYDRAYSVRDIFKNGVIKIYSGTQPASADDAPTGTLLCTISVNGTSQGISFADAVNGVLSKNPSEVWSGVAIATGTAGWFRLETYGDSGSTSTTEERIDGTIATSGAELNMANTYIQTGAVQTISSFDISINA